MGCTPRLSARSVQVPVEQERLDRVAKPVLPTPGERPRRELRSAARGPHAGQPVWAGQMSRDIGVQFTTRAWNLTTHAIDGDIDDSRENLMADLIQTDRVDRAAAQRAAPSSRSAEAMRPSASSRMVRDVAKLMRTKPRPDAPKVGPSESATRARRRKNS